MKVAPRKQINRSLGTDGNLTVANRQRAVEIMFATTNKQSYNTEDGDQFW